MECYAYDTFVILSPVVASDDGLSLVPFEGPNLAVGNELNKLAHSIAIGRNFAGIYCCTDAREGLTLGEAVVIEVIRELNLTYDKQFPGFMLTKLDGSTL